MQHIHISRLKLSRIAFAVAIACTQAGVLAQSANPASTTSAVQLNIPAGPLSTALTRIGQQSGRTIVADPALIAGHQAAAVNGRLSADEAVRQALSGSDLTAETISNGALHIRRKTAAEISAASIPSAPDIMPTVVVTTERSGGSLMQPTRQITVIEGQELADLRATSPNLGAMLTKSVPGLSDSSRNLTDFGQTLRGRNALVLVDGIPLNTNRDSARNLVNIDPSRINRIEVLRGSNAIYGSGASGGIISVTTRPVGGEPVAETTISMDAALSKLTSKGLGAQVQHYFSGKGDVVDYEVDASYRRIGGSYDAHGDRIAPDASQGDLFDSNTYSLGGKIGFRIDANQRLQLAASYLRAKQDTDYASDPAVSATPIGSTTARAIKGLQLANQNEVENTLLSLNYEHKDVLGGSLSALVYGRDNFTRFTPFDARNASITRGKNIDQVMQNNKVFGGRLTLDTPLGSKEDTRLVWGADFIQERSNMPIDVFDPAAYDASGGLVFRKTGQQIYLPWTTTRSIGTFAQLQHKLNDQWSLEGGLRYERSSASVNDFQPLSQSKVPNPVMVQGGKVNYDALMHNAGIVFKPVKGQEFYTSVSQGFDLPDVGLILRNAQAGFNLNSSQLEPVKTDNYELGWRGRFTNTMASLALFRSTSDLGAVQSFNNGLVLTRTSEKINGVEATVDHYSDDEKWASGATFTWMQGRELPQNATKTQQMTGYRIPPVKITGYVQYQPNERWSNRAQLTWFGSKDYRLADGKTQFGRADVKGYYTVDVVSRYKLDKHDSITIGVQNLFNKYYLPLYSQLIRSGNNNSRLPATGATLSVSYTHRW